MKNYFRVFGFAPKVGVRFTLYAVYMVLGVVFGTFNLVLVMPLLKVLFGTTDAQVIESPGDFSLSVDYLVGAFNYEFYSVIQEHGAHRALLFVCIVVLISVFLANIFRYLSVMVTTKIRLDVVKGLRLNLYDKVTSMQLSYFTDQRKGDLISRMTNDVQEVENTVLNSPKSLFREPVTVIVYFTVLFMISVKLTIFSLIVLPLAGGILSEIVRRLKKRALQSQESLGRIVNILDETLGGMRIVKAFNAKKYVYGIMEKENEYYKKVNVSYAYKRELGSPVSEFLGVGIFLIILYYGGSLVLNNTSALEPEQFIAYLVIFSQIISPIKAFVQALANLPKGLISAERIFKIVDREPDIRDAEDARQLEEFTDRITFEEVGFAYAEEEVLKGINLEIPRGKSVALVGPSGGGKSTMADLLPRFYDPTRGSVKLDGVDLRDYSLESLRGKIGVVTQESILFNDTVFNNIAFGMDDPDLEKVMEAARVANAHDFIMELPEKYQTNIGERGMKLSGGQRQRLSIARAVMKDPSILVLDEATSALDSGSEKLVQEALSNLMENRTSLIIAHRLSTIQHADAILVIQDGKIVEQGNHEELLARDGVYKKLSSMQNT